MPSTKYYVKESTMMQILAIAMLIAYKSDPSELFAIFATGKEVVHSIFWAGGDLNINIKPADESVGLSAFLVKDCGLVGTVVIYEEELEMGDNLISGLGSGLWYVVIEKVNDDDKDPYSVQFSQPGAECILDCERATEINISEANPIASLNGETLGESINITESYFKPNTPNLEGYTGPEKIYEINWPGGEMKATVEITDGADLGLFFIKCL